MPDSEDSDQEADGVGLIVPLQEQTAKRIVAGQVITDLTSCVKELVDNALDSGSKSVNIRLFNQGLDVIEVADFGSGVPADSRSLLAMKHATSKIRTFEELYADISEQPQQLGFRGEALFSLANISQNLVVSTRTENDAIGQKLEFRRDGYPDPDATADVARKVGTTVAVIKLFEALPVRRADLIKRVKPQRAKMLRMLQSYAVLCVGVRFNFTDVTGKIGCPKTKTEIKMNTSHNSKSINDTVSQVFGSKFLAGLCQLRVDLTQVISASSSKVTDVIPQVGIESGKWRIEGLISKSPSIESSGKSAREIQFFSINGRPVDLPKISQVVADTWRNFESVAGKKRPACILRFFLPNSKFDINVAPDKREVLLSEGSVIYDALRDALKSLWSGQSEGVFVINQVETACNKKKRTEMESVVDNQPPDINEASQSKTEIPGKRRKMKRRNAFVNTFGDTGSSSKAVFDHFKEIENIRRTASGANVISTSQRNLAEREEVSYSTAVREPSSFPQHFDTTQEENAQLTQNKKENGQSMQKVSASDKIKWNQTMLQFSPARSSTQRNEIQVLESMQSSTNPNGVKDKEITTPTPFSVTPKQKDRSKRLSSSLDRLKAFAHSTLTTSVTPASMASPESEMSSNSDSESDGEREQESIPDKATARRTRLKSASKGRITPNHNTFVSSSRGSSPDSESCNGDDNACDLKQETTENSLRPTQTENLYRGSSPDSESSNGDDNACDLKQETTENILRPTQTENVSPDSSPDSESSNGDGNACYRNEETKEDSLRPTQNADVVWPGFSTSNAIKQFRNSRRLAMNRKNHLEKLIVQRKQMQELGKTKNEIGNSDKNLSISKDDFLTMQVLGQFNLGFILALGVDGQLWILDQHACDEKYNFEKMCKETKIHEQKLIAKLPLELSPSEENCVLENMEIFEKNGFRFAHDGTKPPRHRLSLTAVPHSGSGGNGQKAVQFGPEDVGALCAILGADGACISNGYIAGSGTGADGGGKSSNNAVKRHAGDANSIIRLPKAVAMFASRACRSSIMIGDSLTRSKMESTVRRMKNLDQPWDCAHGRPTIRHVRDLLQELYDDEVDELGGL